MTKFQRAVAIAIANNDSEFLAKDLVHSTGLNQSQVAGALHGLEYRGVIRKVGRYGPPGGYKAFIYTTTEKFATWKKNCIREGL